MNLESHKPSKVDPFLFDDIEDIPFKPLTEGLGFKKETDGESVIKKARVHKKIYEQVTGADVVQKSTISSNVPSELEAFYNPQNITPRINKEISFEKKIERKASDVKVYFSFLIDTIICLSVTLVMLSLMFISTNMSLEYFVNFIMKDYHLVFPVVLLVLTFNIYYIVVGYGQSLGNKVFSIKPSYQDVAASGMGFILKRSNFQVLTILLLGAPMLFGSDTKLFRIKFLQA